MMTMKRRSFGKLALAAGATLATRRAYAADDVLTLGALAPITGAGASWGLAVQGGAEVAAADINAKGGLKVGDKTYQVKVVAYDEQYTAAGTIGGYTRMVQEGIKYIQGPVSSAGAMAIKDMVEENKTLMFSGCYTRKAIDAKTRFFYKNASTPVEYGPAMIHWLARSQPADKRLAVLLNPNDETGWDGQEVQTIAYNGNGFKVVGHELYERTLNDFQPVLTKLLALKPDVIELGTSSPATAGLIVRQARELGFKGRFMKNGGPGPLDIIKAAGKEAAEGVAQYAMADPNNAGYKRVAAEFKKIRGFEPNESFIAYYESAMAVMAAMQKAGTVEDSDKVQRAMASVFPFRTVMDGTITLGGMKDYGCNNQFITPAYVDVITNGEPKIVGIASLTD
jgi:branched-chain amino acid transport system substrate-binding protein